MPYISAYLHHSYDAHNRIGADEGGGTVYAELTSPELALTAPATFATLLTAHASLAETYTGTWNSTYDEVTIGATGVFDLYMPGSIDTYFGLDSDTALSIYTSFATPQAIVPTVSVDVEIAEPGERVDLRVWRHERSDALWWGNHTTHRVTLLLTQANAQLLLEGPCSRGRVRIYQTETPSTETAYSASNVGGYIDGYVVGVTAVDSRGESDQLCRVSMIVGVP
jgi:hypothetical protein